MGQIAQKIVKVDIDKLLERLNVAYCEEWLAYYQYWVGAQVAVGPMRGAIESEFLEHAEEEYKHAKMICKRIIELGGEPVLNPKDWDGIAQCKYDAPTDPYVVSVLKQNLISERCAITRYQEIADMCKDKDYETHHIAIKILQDELDHEQDIEDYLRDIEITMKHSECKC